MTIQAKQKYTAEFKDDAVKRANDRELCISSITGFISIAAHLNLMRQCEVIRWAETHKKDVARLTEERYLWTERQCTLRDAQDRLYQRNTHGFWNRARIITWHYCVRCYLLAVARVTAWTKAIESRKTKRRFRATTNSKHTLPIAPNQLARQSLTWTSLTKPMWVTSLTYTPKEGWLYLAVVIDLYSRPENPSSTPSKFSTTDIAFILTMATCHL